jgi:tetratricopeptide (TPR) repeat protein
MRISLLLLASLLIASPGLAVSPESAHGWLRVETGHFVLFGNATESKIRETGLELERLRATLGQMTRSGVPRTTAPTTVFVFRNDEDCTPYKSRWQGRVRNIAGWFVGSESENRIAMSARWNSDPRPVIFHEYVHDFVRANLPMAPPWFNEGLAEFYSTFIADEEQARIGRPVEEHVFALRDIPWLPLGRLFAVEHDSPEYNEAFLQGIFYAESWALVHYLRNGNPDRRGQLGRLFEASRSGHLTEPTFLAATGSDFATFEAELRSYLKGGRFPYSGLDLRSMTKNEPKVRAISPAETLARLGGLLAAEGSERSAEAEEHFLLALELEPGNPTALSGLAELRSEGGEGLEAERLFRLAVANPSADAQVWYGFGSFLLDRLSGQRWSFSHIPVEVCLPAEEAREAFSRAWALDSDLILARARFGQTYFFADPDALEPGIAALEEASARLTTRQDLLAILEDLKKLRDDAAAWRAERRAGQEIPAIPGGPPPSRPSAPKSSRFEGDPVQKINALFEAKKWDEAEAFLESVLSKDAPTNPFLRQELDRIRPKLRRNRLGARYNHGVELFNQRLWKEALAELSVVAEAIDVPELAGQAKTLIREIEKQLPPKKR